MTQTLLKECYELYFEDVYKACLKITKCAETSLIIQALVFKSLYQNVRDSTPDFKIKAFLLKTARELSLKYVKRELSI